MLLVRQVLRPKFLAVLGAAVALLAAVLLTLSGHSASAAAEVGAPASAAAASAPAAPLQAANGTFSVFARAATAEDDISGWRIPRNGVDEKFGMQFNAARVVYQDATKAVAAVPTAAGPCLVSQYRDGSGGLTCSPTFTHGVSVGLVPDAVKTVSYTMTDGSTQTETVTDNTWHSPTEAAQVTYVLDGTPHVEALMPLSALPKGSTIAPTGLVTSG